MTLENFSASIAGAMASALSYHKRGFFVVSHVFLTSFCVAFYGAADMISLVGAVSGFVVSSGSGHFLTAYYGAAILDYLGSHIKSFILKWK